LFEKASRSIARLRNAKDNPPTKHAAQLLGSLGQRRLYTIYSGDRQEPCLPKSHKKRAKTQARRYVVQNEYWIIVNSQLQRIHGEYKFHEVTATLGFPAQLMALPAQ
jgi:hypothetical protein